MSATGPTASWTTLWLSPMPEAVAWARQCGCCPRPGDRASLLRVLVENPGHPRVDTSMPGTLRVYWEEALGVSGAETLVLQLAMPEGLVGVVWLTLLGFDSEGNQVNHQFETLATQQRGAPRIGVIVPLLELARLMEVQVGMTDRSRSFVSGPVFLGAALLVGAPPVRDNAIGRRR